MRYPICPRVRAHAHVVDGELIVELFEGLAFPARASFHTINDALLPLTLDDRCVVYEDKEDDTRIVVVAPNGDAYAIVFDDAAGTLLTLLELTPEGSAAWEAGQIDVGTIAA